MLGEVALYSFIVLLLTGTYLGAVLRPVDDRGHLRRRVHQPARRGHEHARTRRPCTSRSTCAAGCSCARCTTGRRCCSSPRWSRTCSARSSPARSASPARPIGSSAWCSCCVGSFEGFTGYSLPDDLLSGTGLRIMSGFILSIPVIGTWSHWAVFGGEFPGTEIIPRLYIIHVLLLPGVLLALIGVHVGLVWYQKHTQFPGRGPHRGQRRRRAHPAGVRGQGRRVLRRHRRRHRHAGRPVPDQPDLELRAVQPGPRLGGLAARLLHGLDRRHGPTVPRRGRSWSGNYRIPAAFWATAAFLPLIFVVAGVYPSIERKITKDNALHNLLQRPRDVPVRTSLGVMAIAFYVVLLVSLRERLVRVLLRRLAQRHHLDGPHRAAAAAAAGLLGVLPGLPRPAALRPRRARARHRDRHHQAAAARRVHRGAPAAGRGRRPRPPHPAGPTRARRCRGR